MYAFGFSLSVLRYFSFAPKRAAAKCDSISPQKGLISAILPKSAPFLLVENFLNHRRQLIP